MTDPDTERAETDRYRLSDGLNRRRLLQASGVGIAGLAGCTGGGGDTPTPRVRRETVVKERTVVQEKTVVKSPGAEDLAELHTLSTEGSINTAVYLYSINEGVWRDHGIDLTVEIAPFGKFSRQVVSGIANIGATSLPAGVKFVNQGEDITMIAQRLNLFNRMFTLADSSLEEVPGDLSDAVLGVPFSSSTTTNAYQAIFLDEYGFDILEDPAETRSSPPPVLWNLLLDGEVDAIIQFSGFTIRGASSDEVRTLFDPYTYWNDRFGVPPPVSLFHARPAYIQDNPDLSWRFLEAFEESLAVFNENIDEALGNFGRLAGITSEAEAQVVKDWMRDGIIFGPITDFDDALVDNNYELVRMMVDAGALAEAPAKDPLFTSSEEFQEML